LASCGSAFECRSQGRDRDVMECWRAPADMHGP
jgi:hypothetical protein